VAEVAINFIGMAGSVEFDAVVTTEFDGFSVETTCSQNQLDADFFDRSAIEQTCGILRPQNLNHILAICCKDRRERLCCDKLPERHGSDLHLIDRFAQAA